VDQAANEKMRCCCCRAALLLQLMAIAVADDAGGGSIDHKIRCICRTRLRSACHPADLPTSLNARDFDRPHLTEEMRGCIRDAELID